jgi:hypothetical protein
MLSRTVLDLHTDPFAHGQLYMVLLRVKTRRDTLCLFTQTNENKILQMLYFPSYYCRHNDSRPKGVLVSIITEVCSYTFTVEICAVTGPLVCYERSALLTQ